MEIVVQYGIVEYKKSTPFFAAHVSMLENNNFTFATDWTTVQINNCYIYKETIGWCSFLYFLIPRLARARLCKQTCDMNT